MNLRCEKQLLLERNSFEGNVVKNSWCLLGL